MKGAKTSIQEVMKTKFPKIPYEEWAKVAEKGLGSSYQSFDEYENLTIKPLYTIEELEKIETILSKDAISQNHWFIAQNIKGETVEELVENVKIAINHGQTLLSLKIPDNWTIHEMNAFLQEVNLEENSFFIETDILSVPVYSLFDQVLQKKGLNKNHLTGFIGSDPIEYFCKGFLTKEDCQLYYDYWGQGVQFAHQKLPNVKTVLVDGRIFEGAGGNTIQQLAYSLATAVSHVEQLKKSGLSLDEIFEKFVFAFSIRSNFFIEIAKLRAAKYLWAKVQEAYGFKTPLHKATILAETSFINKSKFDLYSNLLRLGGEAFSSVIGGVDYLRIHPFDEFENVFGSEFGERLSRNIHHLLNEESKLSAVCDPSSGSYFIESLTHSLIEKAWQTFLEIEEEGILQALSSGRIQKELASSKEILKKSFDEGKLVLIGTNKFTLENDALLENIFPKKIKEDKVKLRLIPIEELQGEIKLGEKLSNFTRVVTKQSNFIQPIVSFRLSEELESSLMKGRDENEA